MPQLSLAPGVQLFESHLKNENMVYSFERESDRASIHWFSFQMFAIVKIGWIGLEAKILKVKMGSLPCESQGFGSLSDAL